jgi:hypothetical protein
MTVQRTVAQKYKRYAFKKAAATIMGFRPDAILGRVNGPRTLLNSIPKSGTHLLERAIERMPGIRNAGRRTIDCWDSVDTNVIKKLKKIPRGAFLNAHLTALPEVLNVISHHKIKVIFMIRDPRDVIVSYAKYLQKIDLTHPSSKYIRSLPSDSDRINAIIDGVSGLIPSIHDLLKYFLGWLYCRNICICRFEDLVGPAAGGSKGRQETALKNIADYFEIGVNDRKISEITKNLYSENSSTYRNPKLGGWRKNLSKSQTVKVKFLVGSLMEKYGYKDW